MYVTWLNCVCMAVVAILSRTMQEGKFKVQEPSKPTSITFTHHLIGWSNSFAKPVGSLATSVGFLRAWLYRGSNTSRSVVQDSMILHKSTAQNIFLNFSFHLPTWPKIESGHHHIIPHEYSLHEMPPYIQIYTCFIWLLFSKKRSRIVCFWEHYISKYTIL